MASFPLSLSLFHTEYFLDALRIDPTFTYGAIMYGNLLTQRGHDDEITEVFFTPLSDAV